MRQGSGGVLVGSTQACSATLLLSLTALLTTLVSLLSTFLGCDSPEQFGLHDAYGHASTPPRGNGSSRAESSMSVTSSTSDGVGAGPNQALPARTPPPP
jgi:hypothetical protein